MSLTVALNTAVSGLLANQEAIAATSENIANVNSPDFVRREARFTTDAIPNQFSGVQVDIQRAGADQFLQAQQFSSISNASQAGVVSDALARIEQSLGAPGQNISFSNELDEAFAAFTQLSATPSSTAARAVAISELDGAFAAFARTLNAIDGEITGADQRLQSRVDRVNVLLNDISNLNDLAPTSNGAVDEINARLRELSELVDVSVTRADDGRVSVTTRDGQLLVNENSVRQLSLSIGDVAQIGFAVDNDTALVSINTSLNGGEIGGLLQLRNQDAPALRGIVDTAARNIATAINSEYEQSAAVGSSNAGILPLVVETSGSFSVNAAILADPSSLAIARPSGDALGGANDGAGAAAIANLGSSQEARAAAETIAQIGAASREATERAATAQTFQSEIESRILGETGVNLDEELSNLILFQRSFSANARVIAAVDELYASILNIL